MATPTPLVHNNLAFLEVQLFLEVDQDDCMTAAMSAVDTNGLETAYC